ncbi:Polysaccharide lyase [Phytophthora megakarya]|uniref:Probable pectate lyase F n=1 Tax=Phytophthora megakarya TaxID=4795 RepID=A0A225WL37_9STRA|nr:Polysaccharide lyase [Phytophthora megakarya]
MLQSFSLTATLALGAATIAFGAPVPDGTWPVSQGNVSFSEVYIVKSGEVFDGKMKTYDRSDITCLEQTESNFSTAVFDVQPGGTLKNVIIGMNQMEGVHCEMSGCTIENVWWEDVCEDALSIKGGDPSSVSRVIGGGARYADDKVVQHNGYGTVVIDGFFAQDFGKLYRSCGNCKTNPRQRFLNVTNVYVDLNVFRTKRSGKNTSIVMMNGNFGDEAVLRNIYVKPTANGRFTECASAYGLNQSGVKPVVLSNGPKLPVCQYSYDDIHIVKSDQDQDQQDQEQHGKQGLHRQGPSGKNCLF